MNKTQSDDSWSTFLDDFITREAAGKAEATRRRYYRVQAHLQKLLDEWGAAERRDVEVLVEVLPTFLDGEWLMSSTADARTQVSLCDRLLQRLRSTSVIRPRTIFRSWLDADSAVFHARTRLRDQSRASSAAPRLRLIQGGLSAE